MLTYINPEKEYPRYYGDIQLQHPEWQLGDALPEGWIEVEDVEPPVFDLDTQYLVDEFPVEVDGVWKRSIVIRDFTEQELQQRVIGKIRYRVANGEPITAEEALLLVG